MVIDPLLTILIPPANPQETGAADAWGEVTGRFGEVLPGDYMKFVQLYGTGAIGDWLTVLNPFARNRHQNLFIAGFEFLSGLRQIKVEFPDEIPFPLFYEPGGLLPWGISIDGDIFCWLTRGLSGHWTVTVIGRHTGNEEFDMPMTQFLFEALTRKIKPACFPTGLKSSFLANAL
jgi:hypothetical protein